MTNLFNLVINYGANMISNKKRPGCTKWVAPLGAVPRKGRIGTDVCPFGDLNGQKMDPIHVLLGRLVGYALISCIVARWCTTRKNGLLFILPVLAFDVVSGSANYGWSNCKGTRVKRFRYPPPPCVAPLG